MLACVGPDVDFHPLKLTGLRSGARGHDGVRQWHAQLTRLGHRLRIGLSELRPMRDGRILAVGTVTVAKKSADTPFCAVHRISDGLIVATRQYFSDPSMLERIGLIV